MFFAVLAVTGQIERNHMREKTPRKPSHRRRQGQPRRTAEGHRRRHAHLRRRAEGQGRPRSGHCEEAHHQDRQERGRVPVDRLSLLAEAGQAAAANDLPPRPKRRLWMAAARVSTTRPPELSAGPDRRTAGSRGPGAHPPSRSLGVLPAGFRRCRDQGRCRGRDASHDPHGRCLLVRGVVHDPTAASIERRHSTTHMAHGRQPRPQAVMRAGGEPWLRTGAAMGRGSGRVPPAGTRSRGNPPGYSFKLSSKLTIEFDGQWRCGSTPKGAEDERAQQVP